MSQEEEVEQLRKDLKEKEEELKKQKNVLDQVLALPYKRKLPAPEGKRSKKKEGDVPVSTNISPYSSITAFFTDQ